MSVGVELGTSKLKSSTHDVALTSVNKALACPISPVEVEFGEGCPAESYFGIKHTWIY